jgi:hypothetical protein
VNLDGIKPEMLAAGSIIRQPAGFESGYWAGAPGVCHVQEESAFYLTYRIRRPRGIVPDRGGEARIARSTDLLKWDDVWSVTKDQFNSASIERCALRRDATGRWHYFISYVDPADGRWCVSRMTASTVQGLDPKRSQPLFTATQLGLEGVKDPWILEANKTYYMFLSVAVHTPKTRKESHGTSDIFNTGDCLSATGLATSPDLISWQWQGIIFMPQEAGWDSYCRRINSVVPQAGGYLAFYDGSASHSENYEEKTGCAMSSNLRDWTSLTPDHPVLISPHGSKSLRYLDTQVIGERALLFYEFARPDHAHDLRCASFGIQEFQNTAWRKQGQLIA